MALETVVINVFADTAQQIVLHPSWRRDYADYLFERAIENPESLEDVHDQNMRQLILGMVREFNEGRK